MADQPSDFIASFMDDYFAEAEEHLIAVRRSLLQVESGVGGDPSPAVLEELFRSFHSLKGISAMVELREAERLAHEMESCLGAVRDHEFILTASGFDALVDGVNALDHVIAARRAGSAIPEVDTQIARLSDACSTGRAQSAASSGVPAVEPAAPRPDRGAVSGRLWRVIFTPSSDLVARGIKVDTIRARLAAVGRVESVAPRVTGTGGISFDFHVLAPDDHPFADWVNDGITYEPLMAPVQPVAPRAGGPSGSAPVRAADTAPAVANFVRVDLARLDDLMRLVGDLVVSRARLEDTLDRIEPFVPGGDWRALQDETEGIERQLRDLREGVMRVRLVPVAEIFRRMPFVVRDLARDTGLRVQLDLVGQGTEIDKFLIERMMDPVLHLVRNAISHGIEAPDERIAAGKPPEGTIRLAASTIGESVALEVSDDGRGLDREAIAKRARAAGLDIPDGVIDSHVLLEVICAQGFSTRDLADRGSGRGVGMAVVRDTVQELGGTLTVDTEPGRGTTFRATLPLTLAITDALIVHVGDRTFAVPQTAVQEVAQVESNAVRVIENNELMVHRGATVPVIRLARLFAIPAKTAARMHAILIGSGAAAIAILVDRISGQREIVVKTLRDPLVKVSGVSGATELGDGRLVLILDVAGLTRKVRARGTPLRAVI